MQKGNIVGDRLGNLRGTRARALAVLRYRLHKSTAPMLGSRDFREILAPCNLRIGGLVAAIRWCHKSWPHIKWNEGFSAPAHGVRMQAIVRKFGFASLLVLCSIGPGFAFAAKEPLKLVPHRAVYEMTLGQTRSASGITGIDGRMVFEFSGSECNGYSLNMRMVTQMTDSRTNQQDRPPLGDLGGGERREVPVPIVPISERQAERHDDGPCHPR